MTIGRPKVIRMTDDQLVEAWYSPHKAAVVAKDKCMSVNRIYNEWHRLRREGRIPGIDRKTGLPLPPLGRQNPTTEVTVCAPPAPYDHNSTEFDGRPTVGLNSDRLLEALIREHKVPRYDYFRASM